MPGARGPLPARLVDGMAGGAAALLPAGIPSTVHAVATGGDPLEGGRAAGTLLLRRETRGGRLLLAAIPVHVTLCLGWGAVLGLLLPRRATVPAAALAGLGIAALDLGLIGPRFPRIRALPQPPQVADHLAYGLVAGAVIARRRRTVMPSA